MKTLVIYNSKYGHTKKYAEWLAEDLDAAICDSKSLKPNMLNDYDTILFGSSLYAGKCEAANLIAKHFEKIKDKKVALFTCGLVDVTKESNIREINSSLDKVLSPEIRSKIKIFHVRGGIDFANLNFIHKSMLKFVYPQYAKKPENERTDFERDFLETYGQTIDFSDKKMLEPVIRFAT